MITAGVVDENRGIKAEALDLVNWNPRYLEPPFPNQYLIRILSLRLHDFGSIGHSFSSSLT